MARYIGNIGEGLIVSKNPGKKTENEKAERLVECEASQERHQAELDAQ